LWLLAGDPRVDGARAAFEEERTPVLVSAVCVREAAVKSALGEAADPIFDAYSLARVW
jgi:PIN domain nuclease of toxin-antitoxin system